MNKLFINENKKIGHIHEDIYGHFTEHLGRCIYEGIFVDENSNIPNVKGMRKDVIDALKEMKIPVLRWPGGCFADEYHWKDGIGPKETRKKMINTHWGGVLEDNRFGTHEFMELCEQLGCKKYINGNLGSGTVQEMSEWIEYMTYDGVSPMTALRQENGQSSPWKVDYFGIGNESWGCGGNMTPTHYANLYRQYQTYVRNYNADTPIFKICCGPNGDDYHWTKQILATAFDHCPNDAHGFMDGLSFHYYCVPQDWNKKGSATEFGEPEWYRTLSHAYYIKEQIERHSAIMDQYDPERKIGLIIDEWGCWTDVEPGTNPGFLYQQNTMRDAMIACMSLNIFNKNCNRVRMANLAQMVNVLQSVILTEGAKMILTPTYYVFKMYQYHQNAQLLESYIECENIGIDKWFVPQFSESVSVDSDNQIHVTLGNLSATASTQIEIQLATHTVKTVQADILHGSIQAHNTFEEPELVKEQDFTNYRISENGTVIFQLPACSIVHFSIGT